MDDEEGRGDVGVEWAAALARVEGDAAFEGEGGGGGVFEGLQLWMGLVFG